MYSFPSTSQIRAPSESDRHHGVPDLLQVRERLEGVAHVGVPRLLGVGEKAPSTPCAGHEGAHKILCVGALLADQAASLGWAVGAERDEGSWRRQRDAAVRRLPGAWGCRRPPRVPVERRQSRTGCQRPGSGGVSLQQLERVVHHLGVNRRKRSIPAPSISPSKHRNARRFRHRRQDLQLRQRVRRRDGTDVRGQPVQRIEVIEQHADRDGDAERLLDGLQGLEQGHRVGAELQERPVGIGGDCCPSSVPTTREGRASTGSRPLWHVLATCAFASTWDSAPFLVASPCGWRR